MRETSVKVIKNEVGCRDGVAEDCSQINLAVPSCIYSFWHSVIRTSYFLFNDLLRTPGMYDETLQVSTA